MICCFVLDFTTACKIVKSSVKLKCLVRNNTISTFFCHVRTKPQNFLFKVNDVVLQKCYRKKIYFNFMFFEHRQRLFWKQELKSQPRSDTVDYNGPSLSRPLCEFKRSCKLSSFPFPFNTKLSSKLTHNLFYTHLLLLLVARKVKQRMSYVKVNFFLLLPFCCCCCCCCCCGGYANTFLTFLHYYSCPFTWERGLKTERQKNSPSNEKQKLINLTARVYM
jgi:hypothetical protein